MFLSAAQLQALTVSPTAQARGLSNMPESPQHVRNLKALNRFLKALPFEFRINSAYRAPSVNQAVGGSQTSQHPNGLAADITPVGLTNRDLATWLWKNRASYPELDQVIWYTGTSHVHIGICPRGAQGCVRAAPRGLFLVAGNERAGYSPWAPGESELQAVSARFPQGRPIPTWVWATGGVALLAAGGAAVWWFKFRK